MILESESEYKSGWMRCKLKLMFGWKILMMIYFFRMILKWIKGIIGFGSIGSE
jgi:hypothetical protein